MSGRVEITAWRLAVWAYQAQQVHRAGGGGYAPGGGGSMTGLALRSLELGIVSGGSAAGVAPPEDALTVEWLVGEHHDLVEAASIGQMPDWDPRGLGCRFEPVLRGNGKPRLLYDPSGKRAIASRVTLVGIEPWRAEAIRRELRQRYARVVAGLHELAIGCALPTTLKSWRCKGLGVEPKPWANGGARPRLTIAEKP